MSRQQIAVIDYGMGNLHSVASALHHVTDNDICVTADHDAIRNADRVLFPGVGAMRDCMSEIRRLGLDTLVLDEITSGKPVLAICVGMQALLSHSDENSGVECLDHFAGHVTCYADSDVFRQSSDAERAQNNSHLKVPHMGWNSVQQVISHPLWQGIADHSRFYFVHSYYVALENCALEAGRTDYGLAFTSAIAKNNVFATQFHPEKSHDSGLRLLKNFSQWSGQ